ncbi:hypothetical protein N0V93_004896 [Gnomoniopsis smithogilvyi]|uniref:Heterokaryon incompatibility domain-containing protein n=1 Tax=Gnomoniopsis smithogilvyi TaxID=1191159 RepID=A0A9W9CXK1_9PEZI|nr:hypothetical protein N0V93_004896 [Gnomoniopsis smithogilvyi]
MARLTATERPGAVRYRKLTNPSQDVRLLEILPSRGLEDAMICRLVTVSLDKLEAEIYGLSSLLGDQNVTETIYIDGKAVDITVHQAEGLRSMRNLFSPNSKQQTRRSWPLPASQGFKSGFPQRLRHLLRIPKAGLYVWLDSLCVNSNDEGETAHLKDTMKKVYKKAKLVAGWLGPAIETTTAGLSVFTAIDEAMPRFWGDPGDRDLHPENYAPTHKCFEKLRPLWADGENGMVAFMLPHWVGGNDFMHRSYFQRQWILQELFMAKNPAFMIGEHIVPWKIILSMNRLFEEFKDNESSIFPSEYRAAIAELPLGTVYELLEEIMRRKSRLPSIPNSEDSRNAIFPYCGEEPDMLGGVGGK